MGVVLLDCVVLVAQIPSHQQYTWQKMCKNYDEPAKISGSLIK